MGEGDAESSISYDRFQDRIFLVQVDAKNIAPAGAVDPMQHPISAFIPVFHEQRIVAELKMTRLHPDLTIDGLQIDGFRIVYFDIDPVNIRKLVAVRIHFPVIGVSNKDHRLRGRRFGDGPGPQAR